MDPEGLAKLQCQIKENNEELNDFLRDLSHWEKDMKKKDKQLSNPISDSVKLPPVRNQTSRHKKKKKKNVIEKDNGTKPKTKRIPGPDYSSWDKFDVDRALKELDDNENYKNSSCSSDEPDTEDEELEIERRKQQAILEKDKGNNFFKEGKYDEAISCYTSGMNNDPTNALLPANRAMALLKKGSLAAAEKDCDLALSIDPTYVKAYLRRGAARFGLQKFDLAKDDFEKAIEIDPTNKQAKLELSRTEKELQKIIPQHDEANAAVHEENNLRCDFKPGPKGDSIELFKTTCNQNGIVTAVNKPPHRRSKKPLKRIEIKEVLSDEEDLVCKEISSAAAIDSNNRCTVEPSKEEVICKAETSSSSNDFNELIDSNSVIEKAMILPVPQSAYQFYADWQALRKHSLAQYQYLKQLSPEEIPKLFRQSMDAEIFSDILKVLKDSFLEDGYNLYQYLKHLTQIGRFGTLTLFLSQEEQKTISTMLDTVKSLNGCTEEEIHSLRQSYGIEAH